MISADKAARRISVSIKALEIAEEEAGCGSVRLVGFGARRSATSSRPPSRRRATRTSKPRPFVPTRRTRVGESSRVFVWEAARAARRAG